MANDIALLEEEALKEHLSLYQDLPPLDSREGWMARGYADENGEPTRLGEDYLMLEDQGLFDQTGRLTPKGQAFALDSHAALQPENLNAYIIRDKAGLNATPDVSFGDVMSGTFGFVGDAIANLNELSRQIPGLNPIGDLIAGGGAEREAEDLIARQGFAEGAWEGGAQLGAGLKRVGEKMAYDPDDDNAIAWYKSKQEYERFKSDLEDANAAELYGGLIDSADAVAALNASRDQARQTLGNERADLIERRAEAGGQLFGDPSNLATAGVGAVVGGAGKIPMLARIGAKAEQASVAALRASELAMKLERSKLALSKMERGAQVAATQAERALTLNKGQRAKGFYQTGERLSRGAAETRASIAALERQAADAAAHAQKLAEGAGGAQKVMAAMQQAQQVGRQIRSAPARAMGPVLEAIGDGAMKVDAWLSAHLKGFDNMRTSAALLGVGTGNPMFAIPAAMRAAAPVVKGIGNFTKIVGKEQLEARATVPFWRRVADNSTQTPLGRAMAHTMDFATLGGKLPNAVKRTGAGMAAAAPVDLAFEVAASGGDMSPNTLKQSLAETLVFGGGGAFAGAMTKGRVNDLRARSAGDEINFRRNLSPEDITRFSLMPKGAQKAVATFGASFPGLRFKLTDEGPSSYDRASTTATINTKAKDFLRPLIAHEVNHHLEVVGQAGEGIRAMLVGDQGGLLRSKDGKLDPIFRDFMEAYNRRANAAGLKPLSVEDAALEYFNEATVDYLLDDLDSTKLQRRASRSAGERMLRDMVANTVLEMPVIKNLFYRTGGAMDAKGRFVPGNGLLAGGVREIPEARKLINKLMRANAGRAPRAGSPLPSPEAQTMTIKPDDPAADTMFSAFETDPDGNVLKSPQGRPIPLSRETEKARAEVGKAAIEQIDRQTEAEARALEGQPVTDAEPLDLSDPITKEEVESETPEQKARRVKRTPKGDYVGTHLSPQAVQAIRKRGALNKHQVGVLRMLNRAARDLDGSVFGGIVHTATKRKEGSNSPSYGSVSASLREFVPIGMKITKGGNVTVSLLEGNQLAKNIDKRAGSDTGKRLYGGNEVAILADVQAVLDLWRQDQKTDSYFQAKYGSDWKAHKNFINSVLNTNTPEQKVANPIFEEEGLRQGSVIKTYRIDRISKLVKNREGKTMPVGPNTYDHAKINYLPEPVE